MAIDYAKLLSKAENRSSGLNYNSKYKKQIKKATDSVLNPAPYRFDANSDPVAKIALDTYRRENRTAARDIFAKSNANSMGWGNTYGAAVAGQSYRNGIENMTSLIPDLEQNARSRYQQNIDNNQNRLNTLLALDQSDYGRYQDRASALRADRDYYANRATDMRNFNYQKKIDNYNRYVAAIKKDSDNKSNVGNAKKDTNNYSLTPAAKKAVNTIVKAVDINNLSINDVANMYTKLSAVDKSLTRKQKFQVISDYLGEEITEKYIRNGAKTKLLDPTGSGKFFY